MALRAGDLEWPFFADRHRELARALAPWAAAELAPLVDEDNVDASARRLVAALGAGGWLRYAVNNVATDVTAGAATDHSEAARSADAASPQPAPLDARAICIVRETLAYEEPLADFAFAMQGLGSGPISLAGTPEQQVRYLPGVRDGKAIAAFALSEAGAGSDAGALSLVARRDGDSWLLDGEKTWISNAGIADVYVVFARTGEAPGSRGISAFIVEAQTPGFSVPHRARTLAPHPLGTLRFESCRIPGDALLGEPGAGFKLAMQTLDIFRASVAAAALGMARRALAAALVRADERTLFGKSLADFQLTQRSLAEMATAIDTSALLTYRAAWLHDCGVAATREAAMAKLVATESAQQTIDRAVQLFGALGVTHGNVAERLYREIRSLRIYEGASEVQNLIIAKATLTEARAAREAEGNR